MRLEELVSDWELEEIRQELRSGDAPDIVAFHHGIPASSVREMHHGNARRFDNPWTDAEKAFVKDNYPNHGKKWEGWNMLQRTWDAIRMRAHYMGVKRKGNSANEGWRRSNGMFLHAGKVER